MAKFLFQKCRIDVLSRKNKETREETRDGTEQEGRGAPIATAFKNGRGAQAGQHRTNWSGGTDEGASGCSDRSGVTLANKEEERGIGTNQKKKPQAIKRHHNQKVARTDK